MTPPARILKLKLILPLIVGLACQNDARRIPDAQPLSAFPNSAFIHTLEHPIDTSKNQIYCATFLFAWDEIRNTIDSPIQIDPALQDLYLVNQSSSHRNTLAPDEYTSEVDFQDDRISAYVNFKKSLPFEFPLMDEFDTTLTFDHRTVAAFGTAYRFNEEASEVVQIMNYEDDDNFVLKLSPADKQHEIILCKTTKRFESLGEFVAYVDESSKAGLAQKQKGDPGSKMTFTMADRVMIPKIAFNVRSNFPTLEGQRFLSGTNQRQILEAWQRTALTLDEKGAEIESEMEIAADSAAGDTIPPIPKDMLFNKPFFLMLRKVDNKNPYFSMWVANSELFIKQ